MSKVEPEIPDPPPGVVLSPVANKSIDEALTWLREVLEVSVSRRFVRCSTDTQDLRCQIIAGRRRYSTAELYRWIVTRPTSTAARKVSA